MEFQGQFIRLEPSKFQEKITNPFTYRERIVKGSGAAGGQNIFHHIKGM
jgi:hypothetical protein